MRLRVSHQHSRFLSILTPFRGLLLNVLWSQSDFHGCRTPRYAYVLVEKTRSLVDSGLFLGLLLTVWDPRWISTIEEPRMRFRFGHQHSQFLSILTRFVDSYSPSLQEIRSIMTPHFGRYFVIAFVY